MLNLENRYVYKRMPEKDTVQSGHSFCILSENQMRGSSKVTKIEKQLILKLTKGKNSNHIDWGKGELI